MTNPAASALRAATTSFNVLGPVTVEHSGVSAPLGGPRQVAVLARLLIGVGQVVTMDQLVEAVWDGAGPSQPEVTIRSYLSNLRRAIEPERSRGGRNSCIESCSPGYRLAVDPIRIDAHRFEAEVERGRAALAAGDGDTCVDLLERALDRWRGGPYDGVLETAAVVGVRARLEERRLVAVESLAEARLARGEHEAVMPLLEADLAEHPLRERLTELVMLALYRNGRQSEALEVCRRLRAELVNRLGIDPGPAIQKLEEQILNHDIALRPPASATTTIGRRLDQGRDDAGDDPTAGAGSASVVRLEEGPVVRRLVAALRAGRGLTVAVTGEPGSGKTVLTAGLADAVGRAMGRGNDSRSAADAASKAPGRGHDERPAAEAADPPVRPAAPVVVAVARSRSVAADEQMWLWSQVLDRLPEPPAAIAPGSPPPTAIRMGDVVDRIRSLTARQPVLIVLEDCHWADAPSIETLLHVTEELAQQPVGLIVTWRPTERARPEVLQSLRRLARIPTLARVELGGLDPDAIEVLLANRSVGRGPAARLAGGDAIGSGGGSLARRLHQVTAGNPSFVSELLAGLGDRDGVIDLDRGLPLTTNLRELVRERVDGVDPRAFEVLSLAAVVDGPFSPELMAEAGDLAPDLVDQVLERAATGGLVSAAGPGQQDYRFVHPVVADVLRDDVSGPRRARLHARLRLAAYGGATGDDGRQTVDPIASQPIPNQAPAP